MSTSGAQTEGRSGSGDPDRGSFTRKVWITAGIFTLFGVALWVVKTAGVVFLTVFAALLGSVFVSGLARLLASHSRLPYKVSVLVVISGLAGAAVGIGWWLGPAIGTQMQDLSTEIPRAIEDVRGRISEYEWGRRILREIPEGQELVRRVGELLGKLSGVFSSAVWGITVVILIGLLTCLYAWDPRRYVRPILLLMPKARRGRAAEVVSVLGHALRRWLAGRVASMVLIGILTGFGLWLLDIPAAFALGFLAGALSFIPNLGPVLSALPGVLLGFMDGPMMAVWVILVYSGVQALEGFMITPFIEQYAVSLPAGYLLAFQILMGLVAGILGLFVATPLLVVLVVMVQMLYVEDVLGERIHHLGDG